MVLSANEIRAGNIIKLGDSLKVVAKTPQHTKPGKGPAYVQLELKDLFTGNKSNTRLSSSAMVDKVRLDEKEYQYLYSQDSSLILMDPSNFEQITIDCKLFDSKKISFLQDNMLITLTSYDNQFIDLKLPDTVILKIAQTEPIIKSSTVTSSYKPALLNNNITVLVPQYLKVGEKILVKTSDATFVEKAKL